MSVTDVLATTAKQSDPDREGWRIMLATARAMVPRASVDELVDLAVYLAPLDAVGDRAVVEDVAYAMTAGGEA